MPDQLFPFKGTVIGLKGQIAEVAYEETEYLPNTREILTSSENDKVKLEVHAFTEHHSIYCLSLSKKTWVYRGMPIVTTGKSLVIPIGEHVLGRVINLFGEPQDGKGPLQDTAWLPIYRNEHPQIKSVEEVMETGIKVIDFFTPFIKGGKIGFVGGAGVGKSILMTELINNVTSSYNGVAIFAGIGERIREGAELMAKLEETGVLNKVALIFGQMNENAVVRYRCAWAAVALAEYFRDYSKKDVLLFVDNAYRFIQAGAEVSSLLGSIPSELGYQPTLETEVAHFENHIVSTKDGAITAVENVYVPADELGDIGVMTILAHLDSITILSRQIAAKGYYPAVDFLKSTSAVIKKDIIGERHYEAVTKAKATLLEHQRLMRIVAIVGETELSANDRTTYQRGQRLLNYMTQPFATTEIHTGRKGKYVKRNDVISDVEAILSGKTDEVPLEELKYIGGLKEARIV